VLRIPGLCLQHSETDRKHVTLEYCAVVMTNCGMRWIALFRAVHASTEPLHKSGACTVLFVQVATHARDATCSCDAMVAMAETRAAGNSVSLPDFSRYQENMPQGSASGLQTADI
jgi:hypothetical protein